MDKDAFNGWTNSSTYALNTSLENMPGWYDGVMLQIMEEAHWSKDPVSYIAQEIKRAVVGQCDENEETLNWVQKSMMQAGWQQINWREIAEYWQKKKERSS